tara:strand:- start:67 stop:519 length:453 start_codon:yes stop_codon:yes gene_type:complete
MYLLLFEELDKNQRDWLMRNALPVAPLAWVYNAHVKGTLPIRLDSVALKDLSEPIDLACAIVIQLAEDQISKRSLRGTSKQLTVNKLNMVVEVCSDLELIGHAKDLLTILGESQNHASIPDKIEKKENLGIDIDTVREYILRLAKKPSIH